jgi:hypothetical protein
MIAIIGLAMAAVAPRALLLRRPLLRLGGQLHVAL